MPCNRIQWPWILESVKSHLNPRSLACCGPCGCRVRHVLATEQQQIRVQFLPHPFSTVGGFGLNHTVPLFLHLLKKKKLYLLTVGFYWGLNEYSGIKMMSQMLFLSLVSNHLWAIRSIDTDLGQMNHERKQDIWESSDGFLGMVGGIWGCPYKMFGILVSKVFSTEIAVTSRHWK